MRSDGGSHGNARQGRTADRRRHRKRARHLARRRQGRQLEAAHRRRVRHPGHHAIRAPTASRPRSPAPSISSRRAAIRRPTWPSASPSSPSRRRSRNPRIGSRGHFPGPLFLAVAPIEIEWPQREALAKARAPTERSAMTICCAPPRSGRYRSYHERFVFGSVGEALAATFGTEGSPISLSTACASGASAIQLGLEAIRRGETDAALCVATDGSVNPESLIRFSLLSALSVQNDPPQARGEAVLQEPRRLRHGGRRRRHGAGELRGGGRARRRDSRRRRRLRRARRFASTAPGRARTASRSSAASATPSPMPA